MDRVKIPCFIILAFVCLMFFSGCLVGPVKTWAAVAQVEIIHSQNRYPVGGAYPIGFRIKISQSLYIHGIQKGSAGMIPTELGFSDSDWIKIEDIQFPKPDKKKFVYAQEAVEVFSGEIVVRAKIKVREKTPTGKQSIEGTLSYQACSPNACFPPEKVPVRLALDIASKESGYDYQNRAMFESSEGVKSSDAQLQGWRLGAGLWLTLFGIFLGGLALNLTPCVYPLIPITVSYFGGRTDKMGGMRVIHAFLYIMGLATTNSLLGVSASLSGAMLGSALQNPIVLVVVAGILVFLGLNFFGFWELHLPTGLTRVASKNFGGYFGTYFMGLTLGIVAAPCLGPFILGLLTYVGQRGDPYLGFLYFFTLSMGLGLPLSLLAVFSGTLEKLPVSGAWMVWIRKLLGWVLLVMAGYLVRPLLPNAFSESILMASLFTAAGIHLGWLERSRSPWRGFATIRRSLGIILIGASVVLFWGSLQSKPGVHWRVYETGILMRAAQENKPVILDFYAEWCGPCIAMEKDVFRDPEVVKLSKHFNTVRVDLTRRHPQQAAIQERFQIKGVPTIIFFNRLGMEEKFLRIESYVKRDEMLKRMRHFIGAS